MARAYELLAPANNKDVAISAINSGADAVYIGYKLFGARSQAGNSLEDIVEVVNYAHIFRVKVYITLNTLLYDKELPEAVKIINKLSKIGVDGIILQDMGLLEQKLPPVPLIASTQCHNNEIRKIKFLENTGFSRVILPRELSLSEIREISKETNAELESFVQGALCVSYSGQCYMSYYLGGRSANRGECAQPCRKQYTLKTKSGKIIAKDKYLLSLKDFNLSERLEDLINAGITSFKIEGRLKNEGYVKNVVLYYRKKLDEVLRKKGLKKSSVGRIETDFEPDLNKTFNRGFTEFFIDERNKEIPTIDYPNALGEYIGKIKKVYKNYFELENNPLNNADGVCFFDNFNNLKGVHINKTEGNKVYPLTTEGIKEGIKLFRTTDKRFEDKLNSAKIKRYIDVELKIRSLDNNLMFILSDSEDNSAVLLVKNGFEEAKDREKSVLSIKTSFSKLKDTEFEVKNITEKLDIMPFIPVSTINRIRKELVERLREIRKKNYPASLSKPLKKAEYPIKELDFRGNVINKSAKEFYEKRGVKINETGAESGTNLRGKPVMTTKYCLRYQFGLCKKLNPAGVKEELVLIEKSGKEFSLKFDCRNCYMEIVPCD
ncbi:U32 family peptidase [bacterium]|nr:U32 family peptidase [bacterium]